jgi:hypothetical protein
MDTQTNNSNDTSGISREEIESLCILHAVGTAGCDAQDLATRLGLSHTLAAAVAESTLPLIAEGLLDDTGGCIARTAAGDQRLQERLAALVVT